MGKSKQKKLNQPKSVSLKPIHKVADKPLIMAPYKPLPVFRGGCKHC